MDIFTPESAYDNNYFAPSKNVQNPLSALWALSDLELSFKTSLWYFMIVCLFIRPNLELSHQGFADYM